MRVEIPEFQRCCFCLPLRAGLLGWGYFKIISNMFIIPNLALFLLRMVVLSFFDHNKKDLIWTLLYAAFGLLILILFITEFVANIVFIIGGHKKKVSVLRGFYVYNITVLIVMAILIVTGVSILIVNWRDTAMNLLFAASVVTLVVQVYFILLLRSEVIKLKSHGEFKFINNSAEAECIMTGKNREATMQDV